MFSRFVARLQVIQRRLPLSLDADTLMSNCAWEYILRWNKDVEVCTRILLFREENFAGGGTINKEIAEITRSFCRSYILSSKQLRILSASRIQCYNMASL